jgi:hypothetical protein
MPRDVQGTQPRHDIVLRFGPKNIRAVLEFAYRQQKRFAIQTGTSRTKPLRGPAQNISEIPLGLGAQPGGANASRSYSYRARRPAIAVSLLSARWRSISSKDSNNR